METNIHAAFWRKDDLRQAREALLRQGVIDIQTLPPVRRNKAPVDHDGPIDASPVELGEEVMYPLNVFVEKSRFRQAEDTILKFGGQF